MLTLTEFYNAILEPRGFVLPPHLMWPAACLEDQSITKLMLIAGPSCGKSQLLTTIYPSYRLGMNPSHTIIGVSGSEGLIQGFMSAVMELIEFSYEFRQIFKTVRPDKEAGWSLEKGAFVTGRAIGDPDAGFWAGGLGSKTLVGKHASEILLDDLHNDDNSMSAEQCRGVVRKYYNTLLGRAKAGGARFVLAGRRWHEEDIYGHLGKAGSWVSVVLPAERVNSSELWCDITIPHDVSCAVADMLGRGAIVSESEAGIKYKAVYGHDPAGKGFFWVGNDAKRKEIMDVKRNAPATFESTYQCNPGAREGTIFLEEDFASRFIPPGNLGAGISDKAVAVWCDSGIVIQAWDTAYGQSADSAYTVCVTGLLKFCKHWHKGETDEIGECDPHFDVHILDVWRDKPDFGELTVAFRKQYQKWKPQTVCVEDKASGIPLIQVFKKTGIHIKGVKVPVGKRERALNVLDGATGSVQGWFRSGRVHFPVEAPWMDALKAEMKDFMGDNSGKKDQVDAIVHLIAYAIQRGSKSAMMSADWSPETVDAKMGVVAGDIEIDQYAMIGVPRGFDMPDQGGGLSLDGLIGAMNASILESDDFFGATCARCRHYERGFCTKLKRGVAAIDGSGCSFHSGLGDALVG